MVGGGDHPDRPRASRACSAATTNRKRPRLGPGLITGHVVTHRPFAVLRAFVIGLRAWLTAYDRSADRWTSLGGTEHSAPRRPSSVFFSSIADTIASACATHHLVVGGLHIWRSVRRPPTFEMDRQAQHGTRSALALRQSLRTPSHLLLSGLAFTSPDPGVRAARGQWTIGKPRWVYAAPAAGPARPQNTDFCPLAGDAAGATLIGDRAAGIGRRTH